MKRVYLRRSQWSQPARFGVSLAVIICVLSAAMTRRSSASDIPSPPSFEERLQAYGFATESDGDIQRILQDDMYVFRELGLRLVAERKGEQAIETLKQFLEDEKLPVRMTAASLLGKLGDSSGLPVMRQEYESLIGPEENQRDVEALRELSPYAINPGLEVAEALAELGDYRGYHLALSVFGNKDSKILALRPSAMDVLGHIAQADPKVLASHGIDLHAAYDKAIDSADSTYLFQRIIVSINKEEFNPALASYVADRLLDTHRLPDWAEEHVRDTVKPRIELRRQQSQGSSRAGTTSGTRGLSAGATSRPASQPTSRPATRPADAAGSHSEKQSP